MTGLLLIILSSVFFPGIILRIKSIASGRKGPGIMQPVKDIIVLFRKNNVFSDTSSLIFQIAPAVGLTAVLCSSLLIPFADKPALINFDSDFVYFSYILALGKFFMIIAALDTGSGFEGMGANREALFSMITEPAFFILLGTFSMLTGYTSFSDIFTQFYMSDSDFVMIFSLIGVYILIQIAMIENSRFPVDDPKTHLELTMIHEVMILDNSGFDKALIHITTYLKFAIYGSLIYNISVPAGWNIYLQLLLFAVVQALFASTVGILESFRARNRMRKNPDFILTLTAISIVAFVVVIIIRGKMI
ncbi:MAG: NADH-quinone oxidoreductase subunit H [Candidatus Delongbacteria bacterium]|jgi:formate hydrogenlyase subunit 4|nr:NADH-quinone oxidoreductase subunit H [Candidatus Delongbacteria bacterium]